MLSLKGQMGGQTLRYATRSFSKKRGVAREVARQLAESPAPSLTEPRAQVACSGGGPGAGPPDTPPPCLLIGPFETGGGDSPRTLRPRRLRRLLKGVAAPHRLSRDVAAQGEEVTLLGQGG